MLLKKKLKGINIELLRVLEGKDCCSECIYYNQDAEWESCDINIRDYCHELYDRVVNSRIPFSCRHLISYDYVYAKKT